jgi:poly(3-hydroxybutyrate) depolymerase
MSDDIPAIGRNGTTYPNWDALVAAETHGFVVVAVPKELSRNVVPWVVGPWPTKREANNAKLRMKTKLKKDYDLEQVRFYIRLAWKDV